MSGTPSRRPPCHADGDRESQPRQRRDALLEDHGGVAVGADLRPVAIPAPLRPLLRQGRETCRLDHVLFAGRSPHRALSRRTLERIIRSASRRAGIDKHITPMVLRHSFAVHSLEQGTSEPVLQQVLGHRHLETTMRYHACCGPEPPAAAAAAPAQTGGAQPAPHPGGHPTPLSEALDALWSVMHMAGTESDGTAQHPPVDRGASATPHSAADRIRYFYRTLRTRFFRLWGLPIRR